MIQIQNPKLVYKLALALGVMFALSILCNASGEERHASQPKDMAAIIALEERDVLASKANDVETLVSLWTDDGVLLQPGAEPTIGLAAIRRLLQQQKEKNASASTLSYEEDWKERKILGDHAYEWGLMSATVRLSDGKEVLQRVSAIRVLRRETNGSWKVARAIISPVSMQKR